MICKKTKIGTNRVAKDARNFSYINVHKDFNSCGRFLFAGFFSCISFICVSTPKSVRTLTYLEIVCGDTNDGGKFAKINFTEIGIIYHGTYFYAFKHASISCASIANLPELLESVVLPFGRKHL